MSRTFTAAEIINRAKTRADLKNSNFVSEDEWVEFMNDAYSDLYNQLTYTQDNYFVDPVGFSFNIGPTADTYDLPSDFFKIEGVDYAVDVSNNHYVALKPFTEAERNVNSGQTASIPDGQVRILYTPSAPVLTAASVDIQGVSNFEKIVSLDMAISALEKMERDTSTLEIRRMRYMKTIEENSQERDFAMPGRVSDTTIIGMESHYSTLRYKLYKNKIKFISTELIVPYAHTVFV